MDRRRDQDGIRVFRSADDPAGRRPGAVHGLYRAKNSRAGRFGTFILFFALGLGVLGFLIKSLVIAGLESA